MKLPATMLVVLAIGTTASSAPPADDEAAWGAAKDGLASRLTLVTKQPALGSPIKLKLEVKNVGDMPASYDDQQAATNGSLSVSGPDTKPVPYVGGSYQTMGHGKTLKPGESKTIFAELDLGDQYLIDRAGTYKLQTVSRGGVPTSNSLPVTIGAGKLGDFQTLFGALYRATPKDWRAANYHRSIAFLNTPTRLKADSTSFSLVFTKDNVDPVKRQAGQPATIALGETKLGYGWLSAQTQTAVERWPDYAKIIGEEVRKLSPSAR